MKHALISFKQAGCKAVYLDGSFVSAKRYPGDYDCCWDPAGVISSLVDPILLDTTERGKAAQKLKYRGEFYPSSAIERGTLKSFKDFFQGDTETGQRKGIVKLALEKLE